MIFLAPGRSSGLRATSTRIDTAFKLANSFGYGYLSNRRLPLTHNADPAEQAELYRFVGFHSGAKDVEDAEFADCERFVLAYADLVSDSMQHLHEIKDAIEAKVQPQTGKRYIVLIGICNDPRERGGRNIIKRLIKAAPSGDSAHVEYDFRTRFWQAQQRSYAGYIPQPCRDRVSVCVHVRRGDIAVVPVGDKCLVNWTERGLEGRVMSVAEFQQWNQRSTFPHVAMAEFVPVLERLAARHGRERLAITLCSDGYAPRYFEWARPHLGELGFRDFEDFCRLLRAHEAEQFAWFDGCTRILGEGLEETKRAIAAFVSADVVIKGSGDFSSFFVQRCRKEPPKLYIDLRKDEPAETAQKMAAYETAARTTSPWNRLWQRLRRRAG